MNVERRLGVTESWLDYMVPFPEFQEILGDTMTFKTDLNSPQVIYRP
jgi:hypothetical protein